MGRIGIWELVAILAILVFIFGAKKLPEITRSVAESIKEFKKSLNFKENKSEDKEKDAS